MGVLKNRFGGIRIVKADMIQLDLILQLDLLCLGVCLSLRQHSVRFHPFL